MLASAIRPFTPVGGFAARVVPGLFPSGTIALSTVAEFIVAVVGARAAVVPLFVLAGFQVFRFTAAGVLAISVLIAVIFIVPFPVFGFGFFFSRAIGLVEPVGVSLATVGPLRVLAIPIILSL